jgi:dihydrofolate synthase/folylpolyglutamate synthase
VGLGGRLDATNIVEPELCVITPVDFDHEQILGMSIEAIAFEKAGILKRGVPAVIAPQRSEADAVIRSRARELDVRLLESGGFQIDGLQLRGRHQITNAQTAAAALRELEIPEVAIVNGIRGTRWSGRLEQLQADPEIIVDGAHNPAGARALAAYVAEFYSDPKPVLIFGAMRDKAVEEMAGILFPWFREVIVTAPDQPRALAPEIYRDLTDHASLQIEPNLTRALERAKRTGGPIFVSGSLFLVAEAMQLVGRI